MSHNIYNYNIIQRTRFIIVIDIANQQVVDTIANLEVLLSPNKLSLKMQAYVVENLQPGLIIANNILNRKDVDLQHDRKILKLDDSEVPLSYLVNINADHISFYYSVSMVTTSQNVRSHIKRK